MEVPLAVPEEVSLVCKADKMLLPGAQMFVHAPKFENEDRASWDVVEPTVMADGMNAGENSHESSSELPPATTTTTLALVAASTASFIADWTPGPPKLMLATAGRRLLVANQSNAP